MSVRRTVPGLDVRLPIGHMLPTMFHEDELAQRWCAGLDDVVAPVPATIENFAAYLDPRLAPLDFVEWLSTWVGLELDQTWSEPRRRDLVASAHALHDFRGTVRGLADLIELYTGIRPEVSDGGGVRWSSVPDADLPGDDDPELVIRLRVADPDSVDRARLESMVTLAKPAHIRHRIDFDSGGRTDAPPPPPTTPPTSPPTSTPTSPPTRATPPAQPPSAPVLADGASDADIGASALPGPLPSDVDGGAGDDAGEDAGEDAGAPDEPGDEA